MSYKDIENPALPSKETIRDELVRALEYGHITTKDLKWFDGLFNAIVPSKKEVLQDLDILQTNAVEGLEETQNTIDSKQCIDNIREYINAPSPLDSEVEEALDIISEEYVIRESFSKNPTYKELNTIRKALSDKDYEIHRMKIENGLSIAEWGVANKELQSQLDKVREVIEYGLNNRDWQRFELLNKMEQIIGGEKK